MSRNNDFLKIAKNTLSIERSTLDNLISSLDKRFLDAIDVILSHRGKLVVTGIGKSAIVAQKIVATLNSTGTTATFMHAADAIHGDLGIIDEEDVIICLSKSGETPEIRVLIAVVEKFGNPLIAMTSNDQSTLAKHAQAILYTPVDKEADPNKLAPTSSTIAQMAMGDALAMCLLSNKGFEARDFAKLHPGGSLGKQLHLKLGQVIDQKRIPRLSADATIAEVVLEISSKRQGAVVITDDNNAVLGLITDGDLRRMLQREDRDIITSAAQIMTPNPIILSDNLLAVEALNVLETKGINQIIVIDDNQKYLGVVHMHDLLREGIA